MMHAKYSPSKLSRILNCPGSADQPDERSSSYADKGTELHEAIADYMIAGKSFNHLDPGDQRAIEDCLRYYDNLCKTLDDPITQVESLVTLEHWDPCLTNVWGTADVVVYDKNELHIIDWKFGKGVFVEVNDNDQLLAYLAGAVKKHKPKYGIHIVQPFLDNFGYQAITPQQLNYWVLHTLVPGIQKVLSGDSSLASGSWCRWCRKTKCKERFDFAVKTAQEVFAAVENKTEVTDEQLADLLLKADKIQDYFNQIRKYAFKQMMEGKQFPRHKLVAGRSIRKWKNPQKAEEFLIQKLDIDEVYESKLISPAKAEKLVSKKELAPLIDKPKGKPILAPETDKRRPYTPFEREE